MLIVAGIEGLLLGKFIPATTPVFVIKRRFQPIFITEHTLEQTIEILRGLRDRYEAHHKIRITDEAIVAAAEFSDRYITNRFLPDKAIDLIDQAAARVRILNVSLSEEIIDLRTQMDKIQREKESFLSRKDYEKAKRCEKEIKELEKQVKKLTEN